jgi:hypothetical protein
VETRENKMSTEDRDEKHISKLIKEMQPMVKGLQELQAKMKSMGLFADDRDLAQCQDCQLFEDVDGHGMLFVYKDKNYEDTGLRFEELNDGGVKCPGCSKVFCPYDADFHSWQNDEG